MMHDECAQALLLAGDARTLAVEAKREARDGYRSVYRGLGEVSEQLGSLTRLVHDLNERVGKMGLDSVRPPAPSHHDLEHVAKHAAELAVEQSAGHPKIPSERVRAILQRDRNARIASVVGKALWILIQVGTGVLIGHFLK